MDLTRIAERLQTRFGNGTNPALRQALYRRLERLIQQEGQEAYILVSQVAADAIGKRDEGKYFAYAVVRRLREHGLMPQVDL